MKNKINNQNGMKKKINFKWLILILIIILFFSALSLNGYAKYIKEIKGIARANVAKFSFKVNDHTNEVFEIDLARTKEGVEQHSTVQDNYIGPGSAGKFNLVMDATGSETSLEYIITMNIDYEDNTRFPKNIIFYYDADMKNAIYHENNIISLNGYIPYSDENKIHTRTIYWKWDYETGQSQDDIVRNDAADSIWMKRNTSLSINVKGKQTNINPTINQCTATFNANGGSLVGYGNAEKVAKIVTYNESYGELPIPERAGYTFVDWIGKNLFDGFIKGKGISSLNGIKTDSKISARTEYIEVDFEKNNYYYCSGLSPSLWSYVAAYNENFEFMGRTTGTSREGVLLSKDSFSSSKTNAGGKIKYLIITQYEVSSMGTTGSINDVSDLHVQLEVGNTFTEYEPYQQINSLTEVTKNTNHTLTAKWIKE